MIKSDVLRILAELHTFTAEDVAAALDCPLGTAQSRLSIWHDAGYVERVKDVRTFIYGLSDKMAKKAHKLPPVDPNERCLLLWVCAHEETLTRGWIASGDIVHTQHICAGCGEITKWTSHQNWYRGWEGATMDETDHLA